MKDSPSSASVSAAATKVAPSHGRLVMRARGVRKAFGSQLVLDSVDFDLHEGEVVLLRGPNGSGKTTLLNILTGNLSPNSGLIRLFTKGTTEDFVFPRRWWQHLNPFDHFLPERVAREGVGRSWQETRLFSSICLLDNITSAVPRHPGENPLNVLFRPGKVRAAEVEARGNAQARLANLGLVGRDQSSADQVSLGQSKRVAIARAVEGGARILFLDEPLSGLDADGIHSVMALLRSLVKEHRITLVIIEHVWNVRHIAPLADTVWDLQSGRITARPNHRDGGEPSLRGDRDAALIPNLFPEFRLTRSMPLAWGARLEIYRRPGPARSAPMLRVRDLVVRRGVRLVIGQERVGGEFRGFDLDLHAGDLAVLLAPNGWGKTTLLDALAGLIPAANGAIRFRGQELTAQPAWERRNRGMRYLRADSKGFASLSIGEVQRITNGSMEADVSLAPGLRYGQLSGGEKRRVQFHSLSQPAPGLFMLDEPFSALDEVRVKQASTLIDAIVLQEETASIIALPAPIQQAHRSGMSSPQEAEHVMTL